MYDLEEGSDSLKELKELIEQHVAETSSEKGKAILADFEHYQHKFKKIIPNDYKKMVEGIAEGEKSGMSHDEAVMAAFKKITA